MIVPTCRHTFLAIIIVIICTTLNILTAKASNPTSYEYTARLLNAISEGALYPNVVFSPYSIRTALTLLHMGLEGPAANQLENVFELSPKKLTNAIKYRTNALIGQINKNIIMNIANRLYVAPDFPILESYNKLAKKYYSSEALTVDFTRIETVQEINDWIARQTAEKIKNFFDYTSFGSDTRLVIVNAIYFKGNWLIPFDASRTTKQDFYISYMHTVQVDMMSSLNRYKMGFSPELNARIISIPFATRQYEMLIILPNVNDLDGNEALRNLLANLKNESFLKLAKQLTMQKVLLSLPKFKIKFKIGLANVLQKMGITRIFSAGAANYSSLTSSNEQLVVSKVTHEAILEVSEEGAEGAAATGIEVIAVSASIEPLLTVTVDHPFVYAIVNSKEVLFAGYIRDLS